MIRFCLSLFLLAAMSVPVSAICRGGVCYRPMVVVQSPIIAVVPQSLPAGEYMMVRTRWHDACVIETTGTRGIASAGAANGGGTWNFTGGRHEKV